MATKVNTPTVTADKEEIQKPDTSSTGIRIRKHLPLVLVVVLLSLFIVVSVGVISQIMEFSKKSTSNDYLFRAEEAIVDGKYSTAFDLLYKAIELEPDNQSLIKRQADVAFLNGNYQIAQTLYQQASDYSNPQISFYQALVNLSHEKYQMVKVNLAEAKQALTEDSPLKVESIQDLSAKVENIETTENRPLRRAQTAKVLIDYNALSEAEHLLDELITDEPYYRDAHYLLGALYLKQGKNELAITALNKALSIDPNYEPARELLHGIE